MSELLLPIGGGGGTSSDELTATKAQVLEGYTAVTKDSDDEASTGTMQNLTAKSTKTYTSSNGTPVLDGYDVSLQTNSDGVKRIMIDSQYGGYINAWTLFGINADKLGDVSQANVLNGQTFTSSNGIKLSGTMPNNSSRTSNGSVPGISSSYSNVPTREGSNLQLNTDTNGVARISIGVPRGYYPDPGSSYINRPASDFGTVSANNVRSGQTFTSTAGIKVTGTMSVQSAISFSAAAISYNTIRISWKNPAKGPWQGVFIQMSTSGNPGTGGGSRAYTGRGNSSSANASNYVDITGLNANTTYYFTCTSYVDNLGWGTSYNVNAKTPLPSGKSILDGLGISVAGGYGYNKHTGSVYYLSGGSWNGNRYRCGGEEPGEDGTAYWRVSGTLAGSYAIGLSLSGCTGDKTTSLVNQLNSKIGQSVNVGTITRTWGGGITSENSWGNRTYKSFRTDRKGYVSGNPVYDLLIRFNEEFACGSSFYIDL